MGASWVSAQASGFGVVGFRVPSLNRRLLLPGEEGHGHRRRAVRGRLAGRLSQPFGRRLELVGVGSLAGQQQEAEGARALHRPRSDTTGGR